MPSSHLTKSHYFSVKCGTEELHDRSTKTKDLPKLIQIGTSMKKR